VRFSLKRGVILLAMILVAGSFLSMATAQVPDVWTQGDLTIATWDLDTTDNLTLTRMTIDSGKAALSSIEGEEILNGTSGLPDGSFDNTSLTAGALVLGRTAGPWDPDYGFLRPIHIHNIDGTEREINFTVNFTLDTATLVSEGKMLANASDLRIVWDDGGTFTELDRLVEDPNTATTKSPSRPGRTSRPEAGPWIPTTCTTAIPRPRIRQRTCRMYTSSLMTSPAIP
jgi:hypothetical protein